MNTTNPPRVELSVVFPAYNDAGTIPSMVIAARLAARKLADDYEIVVVNDGSTDHTAEVLAELEAVFPELRVVHHPENRGYGGALRTGFGSATKDLIFYTDGDAQYDPREMERLFEVWEPSSDFVNGTKIGRSDPLHRAIIGRLYHWSVRIAFGLKLSDVDCDFRLFRRGIFDKVELTKDSGVICVELMKKVQDNGYRIQEVPVHQLSPRLRQEPVLQLSTHRQDAHRPRAAVGRSRRPESPPATPGFENRRTFRTGRTRRTLCNGRHRERCALIRHATRAVSSTQLTQANEDLFRKTFENTKVLITGGLGFIGSNLAKALVPLGADVLLVDSLIPDYGGNLFNIADVESEVTVNIADVRDANGMRYLVRDQDFLFNLAGQVSHIDSMVDPMTDLEINCRSQLSILEACRYVNSEVRIVYASTRQIYGKPVELPATEDHPIRPTDVNGINKASGERYHQIYADVYGLRTTSLRLTNTYGPRQLIKHNRQGFCRLVHPFRRAWRRDPAVRRRRAEARLQLRRRRCGGVSSRRGITPSRR